MPRAVGRLEAVARIADLAREQPDETIFIGIDGFGAAGKSTLARAAAAAVPGSAIIPVDDFWGHSVSEWDWIRFDAEVAVPLLNGRRARYRAWDWEAGQPGGWREVVPNTLVIVEGVSATRREVRLPWELTVWVDAPEAMRLQRARARDGAAMLSTWLTDWMPSEQAYVDRERPQERVDLIVAGW